MKQFSQPNDGSLFLTAYIACHLSHARRPGMRFNGTLAAVRDFASKEAAMAKFSIGDHVSWNSEAGRVSGRIVKVHENDFQYKGHPRRASRDDPQYEIESDKTDHIAAHKENALTKIH